MDFRVVPLKKVNSFSHTFEKLVKPRNIVEINHTAAVILRILCKTLFYCMLSLQFYTKAILVLVNFFSSNMVQ